MALVGDDLHAGEGAHFCGPGLDPPRSPRRGCEIASAGDAGWRWVEKQKRRGVETPFLALRNSTLQRAHQRAPLQRASTSASVQECCTQRGRGGGGVAAQPAIQVEGAATTHSGPAARLHNTSAHSGLHAVSHGRFPRGGSACQTPQYASQLHPSLMHASQIPQ